MLLDGFNHVAILTKDTDRLHAFYKDMFDAEIDDPGAVGEEAHGSDVRVSMIVIGPHSEFNVFEIKGNTQADHQVPMFERGRIDHIALHAASLDAFETMRDRLIKAGHADEFVTDFGPILSVFFRDPDGLECELCVKNPDAKPGVMHPPGTPAARYAKSST